MSEKKHLLIVHHSQSGSTSRMADAVIRGAQSPGITNVGLRTRTALEASAEDLLWCDAFILGTPENFGYMSGAMKYFLDRSFYDCVDRIDGRPYALKLLKHSQAVWQFAQGVRHRIGETIFPIKAADQAAVNR